LTDYYLNTEIFSSKLSSVYGFLTLIAPRGFFGETHLSSYDILYTVLKSYIGQKG
jgi:hypothetical protein